MPALRIALLAGYAGQRPPRLTAPSQDAAYVRSAGVP